MKRFLLRLLGHDKIVADLRQQYHELADHVWSNAKFMDDYGKAEGKYNSDDVYSQWNKFHRLTSKFEQTVNKK